LIIHRYLETHYVISFKSSLGISRWQYTFKSVLSLGVFLKLRINNIGLWPWVSRNERTFELKTFIIIVHDYKESVVDPMNSHFRRDTLKVDWFKDPHFNSIRMYPGIIDIYSYVILLKIKYILGNLNGYLGIILGGKLISNVNWLSFLTEDFQINSLLVQLMSSDGNILWILIAKQIDWLNF
jgi:hypothetical protein